MRNINVEEVTKNIKEMCIEANHFLSDDMKKALKNEEIRAILKKYKAKEVPNV